MSAIHITKRTGQIIGGAIIGALVLLVVGCKAGPDYKRPVLDIPGSYRQSLLRL